MDITKTKKSFARWLRRMADKIWKEPVVYTPPTVSKSDTVRLIANIEVPMVAVEATKGLALTAAKTEAEQRILDLVREYYTLSVKKNDSFNSVKVSMTLLVKEKTEMDDLDEFDFSE